MTTVVVNLWGGPGAGKTTMALRLTGELSVLLGAEESVEYVGEFAKSMIWQGEEEKLSEQEYVTEGQIKLLSPIGGCDVVVTDSPLHMGLLYASSDNIEATKQKISVWEDNTNYRAINIFIQRDENRAFQNKGRVHSKKESIDIDVKIKKHFLENNIDFFTVSSNIDIADLIIQINAYRMEKCK